MYHPKKTEKILFPVLFLTVVLRAQEPIGLLNDNYLPSSSVLYNPAAAFTSPVQWDINLISADLFAYNNLVYANHTSALTLLNNKNNPSTNLSDPATIRGFANAMVQGPSISFHNSSVCIGIITQVRSAASMVTKKVPSNLELDNLMVDSTYQFPSTHMGGMGWMEVGINLGKRIPVSGSYELYSGINLKYLGGIEGISLITEQSFDFIKDANSDTVSFTNVVMNYGYTTGLSNDVQQNLASIQFKGSGPGIDAGVWITDDSDPMNYHWKAGLSLIDVGFTSFSRNIQQYQLITDESVSIDMQDLTGISSADEFTELVSQAVAGKGSLISTNEPLRIWLPAAFTFQGEIRLPHRFFIHGLAIQRIIVSQQQVVRPNSITLTPRYETKQFAAGIPIGWYDYHRVQVGGYFRFGPLLVGSDNLTALFIPAKWKGADVYFGLHLHPFKNEKVTYNKSGQINCPKF